MKKGLITIISLMLLVSLFISGCGQAKPAVSDEQVLNLNNREEPGALHPQKAQGSHDSWILDHVFEGLTKKDASGKIVPGMAEKWDISADGTVYTFKIRNDAKWSNGDPVTAADFEYAWKFGLNPATASDYAFILYYLKGGEAYNSSEETDPAKLKELEDAVGVQAIDDKTLKVTLEAPVPFIEEVLSFYTYYPINKKVQEENAEWFTDASSYVSNGPFKLTEWNQKENLVIKKNDNYYDKNKVKLSTINFAIIDSLDTTYQMYQTGDMDMVIDIPQDVIASLNEANNPEYIIGNELATYYYKINTTVKPFNNVKVRKALSMGIDRESIVKNVTQGGQRPAFGYVPPGIPDIKGDFQQNAGDYFKEDYTEAKKLLSEGLKEEGMDSLNFTIIYNTSEGHKKIAEAIQEMWRKNLGVEVTLENMEFQVKIDREHKLDYQVSRNGWIGDYIDPMTFLDMYITESTQNDTGFTNPTYDKLIAEAKVSMDNEKRMKDMHEAEQLLMDNMPIIPIYFYTRPYLQKSYVKGVFKPVNRYPQLTYAYIEK